MNRLLPIAAALLVSAWPARPASSQSDTRIDVLLYATPLFYTNSAIKKDGLFAGAYVYAGLGLHHAIEAGGAYTRLGYRNDTELVQTEGTLAYTYFGAKTKLRLGAHVVSTDDNLTDGSVQVFGGVGRFSPYFWNAGVDATYSRYAAYPRAPAPGETAAPATGLGVVQMTPSVGWNFGDAMRGRYLFVEMRGHYIRLSDTLDLGERNLFSVEAALRLTYRRWVLGGFVWSGEQAFAVRQGGFVVYNLSEKHTGGYGARVRRLLSDRVALALTVYNEQFRDFGLPDDVSLTTLQLSIGITL